MTQTEESKATGLDVSFVMPCLDEAETLEACIRAAQKCIDDNGYSGEIVVADNGSTDGSREIARAAGARVIEVPERGYGSALMAGFEAARGEVVVMGDADLSYDFEQGARLIEKMREGYDLVMGSRFQGEIRPGAMPPLHRWLGNPVLSFVGRALFQTSVSDFHCGLRALRRTAYDRLHLRTTGMEFASEMVVKASVIGLRIGEVPVTLRPDGRSRAPHLRTWHDGWRHLRFLLTLSPRWTLLVPGLTLMGIGLALWVGTSFGSARVRYHTLIVGSLLVIVGYQGVGAAVAARLYALNEELGPPSSIMTRPMRGFTLERGLIGAALVALAGLYFVGSVVWTWASTGFGALDPESTLHPIVIGTSLLALAMQTLFLSFVLSMFRIPRRRSSAEGKAGTGAGSLDDT